MQPCMISSCIYSIFCIYLQTNDLELRDIQDALWKARIKWYNIGLRLNVKTDDLDTIDKEAGNDTEEKLRRMISSRLRMEEPCTWPMLYDALKHPTVNFPKEAEELKQSKMADKAGEYSIQV